uniref:Uncharacterized protein n=1 Tax=Anopheles merus TaxID=30066 RepID=A0A182VHM1_ANOME
MCMILSAARTGTVLFSTTILLFCDISAIMRAQPSTYFRSAARPLPLPYVFVGVLTEMKISSASWIAFSMSVEKNRLRLRHWRTTSSRPGWCLSEFHWAIRSVLRSTTVIWMSGHLSAITLHVGPPT